MDKDHININLEWFLRVLLLKERKKEKGYYIFQIQQKFKDNGLDTILKGWVNYFMRMENTLKEIIIFLKKTARENTNGNNANIKVTLKKTSYKAKLISNIQMDKLMWDMLIKERDKEKENINTIMEIYTKDNGEMMKKMSENIYLVMETYFKESLNKVRFILE